MNKYKLDIYTVKRQEQTYHGSIVFGSDKQIKEIFDYLRFGGGNLALEGLAISYYTLKEYTIIQITDFGRGGAFYADLIKGNINIHILLPFSEENNGNIMVEEYILVENSYNEGVLTQKDIEELRENNIYIVESGHWYNWGASSFLENFSINIISNFATDLIKKLIPKRNNENDIKTFKFTTKIKEELANIYNIRLETLFLESYSKNDTSEEFIIFRNLTHRFSLKVINQEIVDLKAEKLENYII